MGPGGSSARFPLHGWLGVGLVATFWPLNWLLDGLRTHWGFFPLWLGYCLTVDGLSVRRRGTSLLTRDPRMYAGLFVLSVPIWWLFEAINRRTRNWIYHGAEEFGDLEYVLLASLSFSTVVPAVFGTAELFAGSRIVRRLERGPVLVPRAGTTLALLAAGLLAFAATMAWPEYCFPFVWLSLVLVLEPINVWLGNRALLDRIGGGSWGAVVALFCGVMVCGFFWEMWNYWSYPKWTYRVPFVDFGHVFEMPALGYLGYLPFSLELFAMVHLLLGLVGRGRTDYVTRGLTSG